MDGLHKASVVVGMVEPAELTYTSDRRMKMGPSSEVEDEARTRIPDGGDAGEPTPEEELPT